MNRYILNGILADLAAGRSVLIVSPMLREGDHAHRALLDHITDPGSTVPTRVGYSWSLSNGRKWIRDDGTKAAATFTSIRSGALDHAQSDVLVVDGYRRMIDVHTPDGFTSDMTMVDRIRALAAGRDIVLID